MLGLVFELCVCLSEYVFCGDGCIGFCFGIYGVV